MAVHVSGEDLKAFAPQSDPDILTPVAFVINGALAAVGIDRNTFRVRHFLAQAAHESSGFRRLEENLNYSAEALRRVWPAQFPTDEIARRYARKPEEIANRAYASRIGNGPESSGDGWRYRGRGIFQLTGRANYRTIGVAIGVDLENDPERAADPGAAVEIAAKYWKMRNISPHADRDDLVEVTRRINPNLRGLADRREWLEKARAIWREVAWA